MVSVKNVQKNNHYCHDCKKEIKIEGEIIKNGVLAIYKENDENISVFKCKPCFRKNPELKNYQNCEIYSRVVGYLRPVQQWNKGKTQEFKERKDYRLT